MWSAANNSNHQVTNSLFNNTIDNLDSVLQSRFEVYADTLYSGRALFNVAGSVGQADWNNFVISQNLQQRYPGINYIAYISVLDAGKKAVVTYVAPASANQSSIGNDLYATPKVKATLDVASDKGVPQFSPPRTAAEGIPYADPIILATIAVYKPPQAVSTLNQRQLALSGFIAMELDTKPLLDSVFNQSYSNNLSVNITTNGQTIYSRGIPPKNAIKKTVLLNVGGQSWQINYSSTSELGLGSTAKLTPLLIVLSSIPLVLFYFLAVYFSLRYYNLRQHHRHHHDSNYETHSEALDIKIEKPQPQ